MWHSQCLNSAVCRSVMSDWQRTESAVGHDGDMDGAAYYPAAWESFAEAEVAAASALAGLLVVACSINISRIIKIP